MDMVQVRDAKGHYTGELRPDAELAAKWAENERRGQAAVWILDKMNLTPEEGFMIRNAEGSWVTSYRTKLFLNGAIFGLAFGRKWSDLGVAELCLKLSEATGLTIPPDAMAKIPA